MTDEAARLAARFEEYANDPASVSIPSRQECLDAATALRAIPPIGTQAQRAALEKIANNIAFAARMKIRAEKIPSRRTKAVGAEEAALQFIKEIRALNATPATGVETKR